MKMITGDTVTVTIFLKQSYFCLHEIRREAVKLRSSLCGEILLEKLNISDWPFFLVGHFTFRMPSHNEIST